MPTHGLAELPGGADTAGSAAATQPAVPATPRAATADTTRRIRQRIMATRTPTTGRRTRLRPSDSPMRQVAAVGLRRRHGTRRVLVCLRGRPRSRHRSLRSCRGSRHGHPARRFPVRGSTSTISGPRICFRSTSCTREAHRRAGTFSTASRSRRGSAARCRLRNRGCRADGRHDGCHGDRDRPHSGVRRDRASSVTGSAWGIDRVPHHGGRVHALRRRVVRRGRHGPCRHEHPRQDGGVRRGAPGAPPGGRFALYEQVRTGEGELPCPLPWAQDDRSSFVETVADYRAALEAAGFEVEAEEDRTPATLGPPPQGPVNNAVVFGPPFMHRIANNVAATKAGLSRRLAVAGSRLRPGTSAAETPACAAVVEPVGSLPPAKPGQSPRWMVGFAAVPIGRGRVLIGRGGSGVSSGVSGELDDRRR